MAEQVHVTPFEHSFECDDGETLLEAALRSKLLLRYGCQHGGCGTCKVRLLEGDVEETTSTFALTQGERADGFVLACASRPLESCTIDVETMELSEEEFFAGDTAQELPSTIREIERVCPDIYRVVLELDGDATLAFTAGQFVNVEVPGTTVRRSYSMANAPSDPRRVELFCRTYPGGLFSAYLTGQARVGDAVRVSGPFGLLKLRPSHRPILMVAGGSGLAPLLSLARDMVDRGIDRPVVLFFGARTEGDFYGLADIERVRAALPSFEFVPVLSESRPEGWAGETGLVTEAIDRRYPSLAHDVYVCGPPPMIDAVVDLVIAKGSRPRNIYFDAFVPAHQAG